MWKKDIPDELKREILLTYSFEEIKKDGQLVITLLQLCSNYFGFQHTTCEAEHLKYYNKLKTL